MSAAASGWSPRRRREAAKELSSAGDALPTRFSSSARRESSAVISCMRLLPGDVLAPRDELAACMAPAPRLPSVAHLPPDGDIWSPCTSILAPESDERGVCREPPRGEVMRGELSPRPWARLPVAGGLRPPLRPDLAGTTRGIKSLSSLSAQAPPGPGGCTTPSFTARRTEAVS